MLDIAMIGGTYDPEMLNEMIKKYHSGVDIPACVLQWKMIEGLHEDTNIKLNLINERRIPTYPSSNIFFAKRINWICINANNAIQFSFINLPIIKKISKSLSIYKELKHWYKKDKQDNKVILIYSLHTPYLLPCTLFAKTRKIKQFLIVPDLPKYMNPYKYSFIKKILKQIDSLLHNVLLKSVDGFILLTKYIADIYNIDKHKFIIIEGIIDSYQNNKTESVSKSRSILYSGALSEKYGIVKLLEAYVKSNIDDELWICGEGDAKEIVLSYCKNNNKIKYFGQIPREEVLKKQREASLLINPRDSKDDYTKYSFPSKTMEYMQSSTPLLMARLKGIPEEYDPFIYWIYNESVEGWAKEIQKIMSQSEEERNSFGKQAQKFVIEEKNPFKQAKKIINFMYRI